MEIAVNTELVKAGADINARAGAFTIRNGADYESAGGFLVEIKKRITQVREYWKGPKEDAHKAHQSIVAREKQMLAPLETAEKTVKARMADYQREVERERREAEAKAREMQRIEAERMLNEAIAAEQAGDARGAEIAAATAEMIEGMTPACAAAAKPTADGVSVKRVWKARVTDAAKVPAYFGGMEIRTVNQSAIDAIAKSTRGSAKIPGVEFYEDAIISARAH